MAFVLVLIEYLVHRGSEEIHGGQRRDVPGDRTSKTFGGSEILKRGQDEDKTKESEKRVAVLQLARVWWS
jgi:hypothetical protein